jgi:hypothetical protein
MLHLLKGPGLHKSYFYFRIGFVILSEDFWTDGGESKISIIEEDMRKQQRVKCMPPIAVSGIFSAMEIQEEYSRTLLGLLRRRK